MVESRMKAETRTRKLNMHRKYQKKQQQHTKLISAFRIEFYAKFKSCLFEIDWKTFTSRQCVVAAETCDTKFLSWDFDYNIDYMRVPIKHTHIHHRAFVHHKCF